MMGNYEQLKTAVASIIRDNGEEEITGNVLQSVLISIINSVGSGAVFAGIATPSTSPSNPDPNMFYIAVEAGTYPNFNLTVTTGMCIFSNESGTWVGHELGVSSQFESGEYITEVSITDTLEGAETDNLPTVGAVNEAVTAFNTAIATERQDRQEADGNQTVALNLEKTLRQQGDEANSASVGYFVCDTAAATAAKVVNASGYVLRIGGNIRIEMTHANTASNVTLNVNGTGAKALFYNGTQASSTNTWEAGEVLEVYYDGTRYQCAAGGGGKFATGEDLKDTSITDTIAEGSTALPTSGAVFEETKRIDDIMEYITPSYTSGYFLSSTGTLVSNASWKVIDFLDIQTVAEGDVFVWGGIAYDLGACICFYDANGNFKNAKSATGSSRTITIGSSDLAIGSVKVRASFLVSGTPVLTQNGVDVISANSYYVVTGLTELRNDVDSLNEEVPSLVEFKKEAEPIVLNLLDYDYWDTSSTPGIRVRFYYKDAAGAKVIVKPNSGYSFYISVWTGSRPTGTAAYTSGWLETEFEMTVQQDATWLDVNTRKSNNTSITFDESVANVQRQVSVGTRTIVNDAAKDNGNLLSSGGGFRASNGVGDYTYKGNRVRLSDYYYDGVEYMTLRHPTAAASGQGGGVYGNYFIQGGDGGYARVYNLETKSVVVDSMQLAVVVSTNHVNNIVFGKAVPSGGAFPYMYVSECYGTGRCFVENFSLSGSTLVQTISFDGNNYIGSNWAVDADNGYIYRISNTEQSYSDPNNKLKIDRFLLPAPTSGDVVFTSSDILDTFYLDGSEGKAMVFQGNVVFNGRLYSTFGGSSTTHRIWINNLDTHELETVIELDQMYTGECESINIWNGTLLIGYPNQSRLYQLQF